MKSINETTKQRPLNGCVPTAEIDVRHALERIEKLDGVLNALADVNARALEEAKQRDAQCHEGVECGPLHGIPIVVKDNIFTTDGLRTTCNAQVFKDFYAPFEATLVKKLRQAGAIILAKANCSEFAYFIAMGKMPSGFGSLHGQVRNPYNRLQDPLGSSTGSAVAVAAGLVPMAIGTETNGSLMSPAMRLGIVSLKPTLGSVSRHGIVPISLRQDTAGPMTESVLECAQLFDVIKGYDPHDPLSVDHPALNEALLPLSTASIKGLRVGRLEYENAPHSQLERSMLDEASDVLQAAGCTVVPLTFKDTMVSNLKTLGPEFKRDLNHFLSQLGPLAPVRNLEELIAFNREDAQRRLPFGQAIFHYSAAFDGRLKDVEYLKARRQLDESMAAFLAQFQSLKLDALMTARITGYGPIGGLPCLHVPGVRMPTSQPRGVLFIGQKWSEETLFKLGYHYEQSTRHRQRFDDQLLFED